MTKRKIHHGNIWADVGPSLQAMDLEGGVVLRLDYGGLVWAPDFHVEIRDGRSILTRNALANAPTIEVRSLDDDNVRETICIGHADPNDISILPAVEP